MIFIDIIINQKIILIQNTVDQSTQKYENCMKYISNLITTLNYRLIENRIILNSSDRNVIISLIKEDNLQKT